MSDSISIRGLRVVAHHGVLPDERESGQEFLIDATVQADLSRAAAADDLGATVDYAELAKRIRDVVVGERWQLIERVAERVAEVVLEHPVAEAVEVTVHKPHAPVPVELEDVTVTVRRQR